MEKESVKKFDLEAAFKALDEIEIPQVKGIKANRVDLKERFVKKPATETLVEDYYDVSNNEDLEEAQEEREGEVAQAKLARIEKIVDLDAESADDLLPSYVGKVIIQCPQCMTLFYKNPEDIEHSDENPDVVNINEVCQHCGNASGYNLIGKVGAVDEGEAENYTEEPADEENELDLDFEEPTEEVSPEGEGEGAEEMSDEEFNDLNLELEEIPEEEPEEEKKEESLNLSKEAPSDFETEHKSEDLTLNEGWKEAGCASKEACDNAIKQGIARCGSLKDFIEEQEHLYSIISKPDHWDKNHIKEEERNAKELKAFIEILKNYKVEESLNKSEEAPSEHETENSSEETTLNEEVDKDLDKKLAEHNDYIEYLKNSINAKEEALKNEKNEEIKVAIQNELVALQNSLEAALPDALKAEAGADNAEGIEPPVELEEPADEAPVEEEPVSEEEPVDEEPKAEEEASVDEQLTEDAAEEEKPAEGNEVDYVEYKHSYCHILEPKLKGLSYLVNVKKVEPKILKGYILKLLKDPEVRWTEKEKEFKKNIEEKEDVYDILNYVKNSIEKAKTIKVKVDDNGELVEGLNEGFDGCLYEVLTESLNKSEEAPSEHETENGSENLTLNEDVDSEIDAIIASWDFNESLNEEGDLDAILDSPEFKEPVSDAEVESIRDSLGECADQKLAEDVPDKDIADIMAGWSSDDKPAEASAPKQLTPEEEAKLKASKEKIANGTATTDDVMNTWESCEGPECEKPLEECGEKPLKEKDEVPAEEEPVEEPVEEQPEEPVEEDPKEEEEKEELPNVDFNIEEVKEVAQEAAEEVIKEAEAEVEPEVVEEKVEEVVADAVEEKVEAEAEPVEEPDISEEPANDLEFDEESVDDLDECSLNKHIDEYLQEVYSNVKCFEATNCELKNKKLIIEGKISFNSGKEKLTMFEFLPAYCEGKLFFEGYNKDFSEDKAFTLNCSINESKTLITESFGYKYKINENLVEGLK